MDRLTWQDWHGSVFVDSDDVHQIEYEGATVFTGEAVNKLFEYEKTELTPDEIELLKSKVKQQEDELKIVYELADKMAKAIFESPFTSRNLVNTTIEYENWCNAGQLCEEEEVIN